MEDEKFKDNLEDEGLKILRLAALATIGKKKLGSIDKSSQHSNLVVINPVSLNDRKTGADKAPVLTLPQHKWSNSEIKSSMSPKPLRTKGPFRFFRHVSDSESSDDDSRCNNETAVQDKPSEHITLSSSENDNVTDIIEKPMHGDFNADNAKSKEKLLSGDELHLDLKKHMPKIQSKPRSIEICGEIIDSKIYSQSGTWSRSKHRYSYEEDRLSEVSFKNPFVSREKLHSRLQKNKQERSFSTYREREEHSIHANRRRHQRSLSQDRDRSKCDYNFGSERRYDISSSRRRWHECSSTERKIKYEDYHRTSSQDGNKHDHSSSSDGIHVCSLIQDRSRPEYNSSLERSRHKNSSSQDRSSCERSEKRSGHGHSLSQDNRSEHTPSQDRSRHERISSHDRKEHKHNSTHGESSGEFCTTINRYKSSRCKNTYKYSSKNELRAISDIRKSRYECLANLENVDYYNIVQNKKSEYVENSERVEDNRFEKFNTKEQFESGEQQRQKRQIKEKFIVREKRQENEDPAQKRKRVTYSKYEEHYSGLQRRSTTSYSNSCSSSSSHTSRPKFRSVLNVINSFLSENPHAD